jgi:DNA invertase Pin-like site-specific DNA recombinase
MTSAVDLSALNGGLRVATYARANVPAPRPDLVLAGQQRRLKDHVQSEPNWRLVAEFTDHASANDPQRGGLQELLRQAHDGAFDLVLVTSFDRLTRSLPECMQLAERLRREGIALRTPHQDDVSPSRLADVLDKLDPENAA